MSNVPVKQLGEPHAKVIENWLKSRQTLIVCFNQLCLQKPFTSNVDEVKDNLNEFCEHLLDYVCQGQFNLFEKITQHVCDHRPKTHQSDHTLLQQLLQITQHAIYFNDHYTHPDDFSHLESELSSLGEAIALRLEIEDELLNRYAHLFRAHPHAQP